VATSVTYTAVLSAREETVLFLSNLLRAERRRRGTRSSRRALGCFAQAVLLLRWFLDDTRMAQLAADNIPDRDQDRHATRTRTTRWMTIVARG
jgi:hypothetical protein